MVEGEKMGSHGENKSVWKTIEESRNRMLRGRRYDVQEVTAEIRGN